MTATLLLAAVTAGLAATTALEVLTRARWAQAWASRDISAPAGPAAAASRVLPAAALGAGAAWAWQSWPAAITVSAVAWLAVLAVSTDLACRRIPREPCWAVLALGTVGGLAGYTFAGLLAAATALVVIGTMTLLVALITKGGLGSGDVRLLVALTPLAWWTGAVPLLYGLVLAAVAQGLIRVGLAVAHRSSARLPFAPALLAGTAIAVLALTVVGVPETTNACREWLGC